MIKPYFVFPQNITPEEPHWGWYFKPNEEVSPIGAFDTKREAQEALDMYHAENHSLKDSK